MGLFNTVKNLPETTPALLDISGVYADDVKELVFTDDNGNVLSDLRHLDLVSDLYDDFGITSTPIEEPQRQELLNTLCFSLGALVRVTTKEKDQGSLQRFNSATTIRAFMHFGIELSSNLQSQRVVPTPPDMPQQMLQYMSIRTKEELDEFVKAHADSYRRLSGFMSRKQKTYLLPKP